MKCLLVSDKRDEELMVEVKQVFNNEFAPNIKDAIDIIGMEKVIDSIGLDKVIESVGLKKVINSIHDDEALFHIMIEKIGIEKAKKLFQKEV